MPEEINNFDARITSLERQIEELQRKKPQQIEFPLDEQSIKVLSQYFMRITDAYITYGGAAGRTFLEFVGEQGDLPRVGNDTNGVIFGNGISKFQVGQILLTQYTANATSDRLTLLEGRRMDSGEHMTFFTSDAGPGGITTGLGIPVYEADTINGMSFRIKDTDGVLVDITSAGSGRQFLIRTDSNGI